VLLLAWLSDSSHLGLACIVIKSRPAQRVDPRPSDWTGLDKTKDWGKQKPGKTRCLFFFLFNVFFLLARAPLFLYKTRQGIFLFLILTIFKVHYINARRMFYFFNVGCEAF
jgi:hypothetical protein